ncbi:hypothetical protein GUITHDRAFT_109910 [Guillardia theta CCMP2712]|uniref:ENTH domain-containing protein n=1 Tax=Guillardia theta (strain CCMP2712) TaxID=905079 RepID=L1J6H9_GUITC|nr:hypothetical protein GUITHDRAFT_109910 [Guillardia theta CCMP2712]EKX44126.1 hypothetical protein GUITHDRAFT_109910 [Guillardia theta CCMP2712]|eukprot:XP_005831106.1 hypothetical protein GUITHDRAFT_109910 [Guillardia theta CCMP2712]
MTESLKEHLKRRAFVIAERQALELELTVGGTDYAPLERAVFKSTKNNTKAPKEKHISFLQRAITDGDNSKTVLKMLARRLKEASQPGVISTSYAAGVKTIAVLHRCMNSGDNSFIALCSKYSQILEVPTSNPYAQIYGKYVREMLGCFAICKHSYQRETEFEESMIVKLGNNDLVEHLTCIDLQLTKLLDCDLQGGLMEAKSKNAVQYAINLLLLDAMSLFSAFEEGMSRVRQCIGQQSVTNAKKMAKLYSKFVTTMIVVGVWLGDGGIMVDDDNSNDMKGFWFPSKLQSYIQQASFDRDCAIPLTAFDKTAIKKFNRKLEDCLKLINSDDGCYETVKALADVAIDANQQLNDDEELPQSVAKISLEEIEEEKLEASDDLIKLDDIFSSGVRDHFTSHAATHVNADDWDPFGAGGTNHQDAANNPFGRTKEENPFTDDPFGPPVPGPQGMTMPNIAQVHGNIHPLSSMQGMNSHAPTMPMGMNGGASMMGGAGNTMGGNMLGGGMGGNGMMGGNSMMGGNGMGGGNMMGGGGMGGGNMMGGGGMGGNMMGGGMGGGNMMGGGMGGGNMMGGGMGGGNMMGGGMGGGNMMGGGMGGGNMMGGGMGGGNMMGGGSSSMFTAAGGGLGGMGLTTGGHDGLGMGMGGNHTVQGFGLQGAGSNPFE